ncbi:hypothetical protein AtDm6_3184 [Acetobacter tropicalis]|uniref:Uncharacterized protein n=1 Tax=Acetobacter tropicalis TaxID=104102 RepID=A0A094YK53_9PROT|nr:hypothetical protein AtDm6_3184 [Acetobacter tropicalis]
MVQKRGFLALATPITPPMVASAQTKQDQGTDLHRLPPSF